MPQFVARKRLKVGVGDDGAGIYREYGDVVPEALAWNWKTQESYIRNGYIERHADQAAPAAETTK